MLIGAIADDLTGATDLGLMLSREGMRTVQVIGVPAPGVDLSRPDAVVIALKSRTIAAAEAVALARASARALTRGGAGQLMFKYCSTFDSTDAGNIGPVSEALLDLLGAGMTIACPAFPATGRTVYQGHLFVGDRLLSESPMKDHPLTPMRDSDLVAVLGRQTRLPVGLVDIGTIRQGAEAVREAFAAKRAAGQRIIVVDTLSDDDLRIIGAACAGMKLVTGGSGIALGLAANFRQPDEGARHGAAAPFAAPAGRAVILAGSCSVATLGQISAARTAGLPARGLDVAALAEGRQSAAEFAEWVIAQPGTRPPLVYSSAPPEALARIHERLGRRAAGNLVEATLAEVAHRLLRAGFSRFVVAGGETAGAVVASLGVTMLEIGPEIDPGVPWTRSIAGPELALALKSGNFGAPDFFVKAWSLLKTESGDA